MNQVQELEQAILARAQKLADQFAEQAERTREAVLREAAERLRQREQREEAVARVLADRQYRQRVQAAELKLQSKLDRVRWNLVRAVEARLEERMRDFMRQDADGYRAFLLGLLREGARQMSDLSLVVAANTNDRALVGELLDGLRAELPGQEIVLDAEPVETLAGVLLTSADRRVRVDNTFEGRMARLRLRLQQTVLERLLPPNAESGNITNG